MSYLEKYDRLMLTVTGQLYTRVLGQNTLHVPIEEIHGYFDEVTTMRPGELEEIVVEVDTPHFLEFLVKGYALGEELTMNFRVWGLKHGRNTVFTRIGWWKIRVLEKAVQLLKLGLRA